MTRNSRLLCCLVAGLCTGGVVQAQQTFGAFKGRVTDKATGAPKAGVVITIQNQATGYNRQALSSNDGTFRFSVVPLGNYRILFKSPDSTASMIRTSSLGTETEASVAMAPAAVATVTVVATADTVDQANTTSAEVGVNVSAERLESLPVLSRNVVSAAVLAPGVQLVSGSNVDPTKKSSTYMSTGEGQGRGTNFNIDGGDNNSTDVGGYVSPIPMDAIGEFQVVTNQYKAEFGRSNAGFLNVVSKAGSNSFSGILSGQYTNQAMRAKVTDEGDKKDNFSQTLAALVSGPIIKDKLFYMVSVERKDEEGAAFTFTPAAIAAFPTLSSIKTKLKETIAYVRLDWAASQMVNVTGTYSYDKNETPNQAFPHTSAVNGNVDPSMLGTGLNKTNRFGLKATTSFTPNVIWESNLIYFDYANGITPNGNGNTVGQMQVRTVNSNLLAIDSSDLARMGHDPNAFQNTGIKRLQWRNDVTYMLGDHFFKAGLDFQKTTYADQHLFWPETGLYSIRVAGFPIGAGAFGNTVVADQNVVGVALVPDGFQSGQTYKQFGFYAQDDWTISPKLSVYAGFRLDKDDIFDFMKPYQGLYTQIAAANPDLLHGSTVPKNKTYFSPRVQMVFKPKGDDSVTFKVGYGKFIAALIDNVTGFSRALGNRANGLTGSVIQNDAAVLYSGAAQPNKNLHIASFSAGQTLTTVNGHPVVLPADLTPYNYANNTNGLRDYFRNTVNGWLETASFTTAGKSLMASDFEYPTTDTINFGGTFKIGDHQTLDLQYIWSRTQHATTQLATDGSDPRAWSSDGSLATWNATDGPDTDMGDTVFHSNQTARSNQIQVKYSYTAPKWSALATMVLKDFRASFGGSAGSYDGHASADFYGTGAEYSYKQNPERPSAGTESFSGSFAFTYNFDIGTKVGVLGTWHSGKIYDIYAGYNAELGAGGGTDDAHPNDYLGQARGDWAMDLGLRISHSFKFGKGMILEPFIQISNILNNYDYGSNYNNTYYQIVTKYTVPTDPIATPPQPYKAAVRADDFGQRSPGYQNNQPRTAAAGFRFTF